MEIQLITERKNIDSDKITVSTLNIPKTFDSFDINIIDLSFDAIWKNNENKVSNNNYSNDFISLNRILESSKKTIIIVLPQNVLFRYYYSRNVKGNFTYQYSKQIKDMLTEFGNIVGRIINLKRFGNLLYENSKTRIGDNTFSSAFVFEKTNVLCKELAKSDGSNKATVVSNDNIILTTLDICNSTEQLIDFIKGIGLYNDDKEPIPEWLKDYEILDDDEQKELIAEKKAQIEEAKKSIEIAEDRLKENEKYKSILYENGNSLVEHVFMILEELLDYDLSEFVDVKQEDFFIKLDDISFIGEIKGVTSNVKSENVSQVDVHYQGYMDKLREEEREENVKQLLIMNPLRKFSLEDREPVHDIQIKLAKRNGCLIITTETLLVLFEKFRKREITSEMIKEVFTKEKGLLSLEAFD